MAHQMDTWIGRYDPRVADIPEEAQELVFGQLFGLFDTAQDGVICFSEFWAVFRRLSQAPEAPAPHLEQEEAAPAAQATEVGAALKSEWV